MSLSSDTCGHHCGILTTGAHQHVGHCPCSDCHHTDLVGNEERCKFRRMKITGAETSFSPRCTKKKKHNSAHLCE